MGFAHPLYVPPPAPRIPPPLSFVRPLPHVPFNGSRSWSREVNSAEYAKTACTGVTDNFIRRCSVVRPNHQQPAPRRKKESNKSGARTKIVVRPIATFLEPLFFSAVFQKKSQKSCKIEYYCLWGGLCDSPLIVFSSIRCLKLNHFITILERIRNV